MVAFQFCKQDYVVGVPLSPCEYDLLVDTGKKVWKIQVKKAKFIEQRVRPQGKGDRAHWELMLTKKKRSARKDGVTGHVRIAVSEFDLLAVVCDETRIYMIPSYLLASANYPGQMIRIVHFKPPIEHGYGRADSVQAGERWEPYRNNFVLDNQ